LFRAVVSFEDKSNTNWRAVIDELVATSDEKTQTRLSNLIVKHTKKVESIPSVRTYTRKGT